MAAYVKHMPFKPAHYSKTNLNKPKLTD